MKYVITSVLFLACSSFSFARQPLRPVLTLDQCIETALKNNLSVNRGAIRSAAGKLNYDQARANQLPDLNARLSHGINQGRSIDPYTNGYINEQISFGGQGVEASLLLFNGMRLRNTVRQYSALYDATRLEEQQAKDDLRLDVTLAYLSVLTSIDQLDLAKKQQEVTQKQFERVEELNKAGNIPPMSYYDLKGQSADDQVSVIRAANAVEGAGIGLCRLMSVPYEGPLNLQPLTADNFSLDYSATADEVYRNSLDKLALVKAVNLRKTTADFVLRAAKSAYYPSVYFNSGLSSNYSSSARDFSGREIGYSRQVKNNLNRSFSIGLSIPIFNSFNARNSVSLARLGQREAELVVENTRVLLQQITKQAYLDMQSAKDRYLALKAQSEAYAESFRIAGEQFNAGVINSVDYLVAKSNYDRTRLNTIATSYDFILRKKVLDYYRGIGHGE